MAQIKKIGFILLALVLLGGVGFLLTWDIPAPSQEVTKTVSNDRFPS